MTDQLVQKTEQFVLRGRGLQVIVPGDMTKPQAVLCLADLASDLLLDLQKEAEQRNEEVLFFQLVSAQRALQFAGESCGQVVEATTLNGDGPASAPEAKGKRNGKRRKRRKTKSKRKRNKRNGQRKDPPKTPKEIKCPTCSESSGRPCRDTRPGRKRPMSGYHPGRHEAFRTVNC